jgi:single-strand DNA-binding protein
MLNQVMLIGRVVFDLEPKLLDDGRKVTDLVIAVQRPFKNMDGQYDTDFFKVTVWEGLASAIESYCTKGVLICIKGRLQSWKHETSDEKKLNMIEIVADRISYLSSPKSQELSKAIEKE